MTEKQQSEILARLKRMKKRVCETISLVESGECTEEDLVQHGADLEDEIHMIEYTLRKE